jgi:hypothetical protein
VSVVGRWRREWGKKRQGSLCLALVSTSLFSVGRRPPRAHALTPARAHTPHRGLPATMSNLNKALYDVRFFVVGFAATGLFFTSVYRAGLANGTPTLTCTQPFFFTHIHTHTHAHSHPHALAPTRTRTHTHPHTHTPTHPPTHTQIHTLVPLRTPWCASMSLICGCVRANGS